MKIVQILLTYGAIFDATTDSGKTPSDFSTDKNIISLLKLISDSFRCIRNGSSKVIKDLNKIKDISMMKAIMNAHDKKQETLVVAAIKCNFPEVEQLKNVLQDVTSDVIRLALKFADMGDHQNALCIFNKIYENRKNILGPNNPGTLEIERYIAIILYKQGKYNEALHKLEKIYQKQKEILGLCSKDTLSTRSSFALVLHRQGRNEEAFEIYKEIYPKQKEILEESDKDILSTRFHMAVVLDALGKHEEALNIFRSIYEENKQKLGANDPLTIRAQNNLGMVLMNQGNSEQALKIYKKVLEKKKRIFGLYHEDTLRTLQSIASILVKQNKDHEALQAHEEVISIQKSILGPTHPETLKTQYNLGNFLFSQGKFANAYKIYTECFEQIKAVFGLNNMFVSTISERIKIIKLRFQLEGSEASEILQHMQEDMKTAIKNNDMSTIFRPLKEGTDVNEKDNNGITFLHYAVSFEYINIVKLLIENGADILQVTNKGNTPLHTATSKNNQQIVEFLLQYVQRDKLIDLVNTKTTSGNTTALHVAAKNNSLNIVKVLLKHGAIFNPENSDRKKPLDLSTDQNVMNLLKLIEELFADANTGNIKIIEKLKSLKQEEFLVVTNVRNSQRNTLLQVIITNKHLTIASKLSKILKK